MNYVAYHVHSDYSVLDSCTSYKQYVDKAVGLGQKAIAFTEHGKPMGWFAKKMYCEEQGIKYIHGVEAYLTKSHDEKIRDNYHTILLAKNEKGFKELNDLIFTSTQEDHVYYNNRISFNEFLKISDNVIKISACVASPLNKLPFTDPMYEKLAKHYDYYEIQPYKTEEQINYNRHLLYLSEKYRKPLIAGTDAHNLNKYKGECREILTRAKGKWYDDGADYSLVYFTYDELVEEFKGQDALPEADYLKAIEVTNLMADSVEDFQIDTSIKYPILYGNADKDKEMFRQTVHQKFKDKLESRIIPAEQEREFEDNIQEELRVLEKIGMSGFMMSMSETISWCRDNDIPIGFGRGSVAGSSTAYISDITDVNPVKWHTVFSRFANEDRVEVGDIDIDVIESDRPKIFAHIIERFGERKTARVPSFGTFVDKGTIEIIVKGLRDKTGDTERYSNELIKRIKTEYEEDGESTAKKYPDIFYYFEGIVNTKSSYSVHPAGMVVSPVDLQSDYGVIIKDGDRVLTIDMEEIHDIGLVKYDFLVLRNIEIIRDTYKMIGKPYPRAHEIDWDDQEVFADMLKSSAGLFQMEADYAHSMLKQFAPCSIFDISLVTAAIRPSGATYRNALMTKQINKNPSELIDKMLENNYGYLVYQEDVLVFLQKICGLTGGEADNVRRAIARKDEERLEKALPKILDGYCSKSNKPREVAEQEANAFIDIMKGAYMFGYNHSIAYCLITYLCAYLRYHYQGEFITAYLNNTANQDDVAMGTTLAENRGFKIQPIKFGYSGSEYRYDKENHVIYKGISTIKYLNESIGNALENMRSDNESFMNCLKRVSPILDKRQLDILIRLNFFSDYGDFPLLKEISTVFCGVFKNGKAKSIPPNMFVKYDITPEDYCQTLTKKGTPLKNFTIVDMSGLMDKVEESIRKQYDINPVETNLSEMIEFQKEYLGYVNVATGKAEDRQKCYVESVYPLKRKRDGVQFAWSITMNSLGSGKSVRMSASMYTYENNKIKKGDIIEVTKFCKDPRGYWKMTDYKVLSST